MTTELRLRRGTTAQHSTFTGASGELTIDTSKKVAVVHDGVTPGGKAMVGAGDTVPSGDISFTPAGTGAVTAAVQDVLRRTVSVRDFGAVGNGSVDDTAAINLAIAYVNSLGSTTLEFPNGNYRVTDALTPFANNGITVRGHGMYSTYITSSFNGDIFSIDTTTTDRYFFEVSEFTLQRTAGGAYSNSTGVRISGDVGSVTGLQYATFSNLRFNNLYRGIVVEDTGKYVFGPFDNNARHAFFTFSNLISAVATDAMYECVVFEGGTGPHHTFIGGQIRGSAAAVRLGTPGGDAGIGDIIFTGVHVVTAGVGLDIYGPTGATVYDQNITVAGCQFDNCVTATVRIDKMQNFRIVPNNSTASVGVAITNCTNYVVEDRNSLTMPALTVTGTSALGAITLSGSLNTTAGSITDTNGTRYAQPMMARRDSNASFIKVVGGNVNGAGASWELYGGAHATLPNYKIVLAERHQFKNQVGSVTLADINVATGTFGIGNGAWNSPSRLALGTYQFWVDATGALRIKNGAPTSDLDGALV